MIQTLKVWLLRWFYRWLNWRAWRKVADDGTACEELLIEGALGQIPARLYRPQSGDPRAGTPAAGSPAAGSPAAGSPAALIVYFHGGGWVLGDLQTHDPFCRQLAATAAAAVIAVDYRRAPEHRFPAAATDCIDATRWLTDHRGDLGLGDTAVFLAGDSAGGNLATVVTAQIGKVDPGVIRGQILIYPATRYYAPPTASYIENATGYGLTRSLMEWFWDTYLGEAAIEDTDDIAPRALPLMHPIDPATAPALIITAGLDPLRDEGAAYAEALDAAGVDCSHELFLREMHGFVCSEGLTPGHRDAMALIGKWVRERCT